MSAPEKLAALRRLLAASAAPAPDAGRVLPTGLSGIDDATGGLPLGAVTEIVCAAPRSAISASATGPILPCGVESKVEQYFQ